jgi:PKD repeat protein
MKHLSFLILLFPTLLFAQGSGPQVIPMSTAAQIDSIISNFMLGGCVEVTNIHYTGVPAAAGLFIDPSLSIGLAYGVILTTGDAQIALGPNNSESAGISNELPGDTLLDVFAGAPTYDACIVEFDFIPSGDTIFVADFVFGSEEYPEFVNSGYNDAFGFFVEGPSTNGPLNVAWIPGSSTPIAIDNVNAGMNSEYYVDNTAGTTLQYDGYTTPIYLQYPVLAGETYHLKVVIADAGDGIYDSGVIIRSQSFCADSWFQSSEFVAEPQPDGMTVQFHNLSQRADDFVWDFGDGTTSTEVSPTHTYSLPDDYAVTLTASNGCFDTTSTKLVSVQMVTNITDEHPKSEWSVVGGVGSGELRFTYTADSPSDVVLSVFDMGGRLMLEKSYGRSMRINETIDLSLMPQGAYVARVQSGGTMEAKMFVR